MSKESIQGPLTALRNAGTVSGVCLVRGTELVVNLFPFSENRVNEVVTLIDDILLFLADKGRQIDQLCFGYDGGNLVIVSDDDYRLIIMHMHPDEIDFIAKAARAFLIDFQVGLFAEQLSGRDPRMAGSGLRRELPPVVIPGETPAEPEASVPPKIEVIHGGPAGQDPAAPVQSPGLAEDRPDSIPLPPRRKPDDR